MLVKGSVNAHIALALLAQGCTLIEFLWNLFFYATFRDAQSHLHEVRDISPPTANPARTCMRPLRKNNGQAVSMENSVQMLWQCLLRQYLF